ncbi:MAG: DNA double-strand break repair nuclease NurA, partial [Thermodesulfobacteriota bacterium]
MKSQIDKMLGERKHFVDEFGVKIKLAQSELHNKSQNWEDLSKKVEQSKTSWLLAGISSAPNLRIPLPQRPPSYTAISSDGSQIFPDRHEVLPCYLINISSVVLHYGDNSGATISSDPYLFYNDEDRFTIWDGKKIPANSNVISHKRTLMEFERLLDLTNDNSNRENVISISDGTLILWNLEGTPGDFKKAILDPFIDIMEEFKNKRIPIVGYISYPGSTDVVNTLRLGLCPEKVSYCNQCPYTELPELPCSPIEGLTDRNLFSQILKEGEMSAVFKSSSKILDAYGHHHIHFFYLNIGKEIARVEIPKWIAEDSQMLGLVHSLVYDQAKKGKGYPVAISESHEKAVVRGKDRNFFFDLVKESMVKADFNV